MTMARLVCVRLPVETLAKARVMHQQSDGPVLGTGACGRDCALWYMRVAGAERLLRPKER